MLNSQFAWRNLFVFSFSLTNVYASDNVAVQRFEFKIIIDRQSDDHRNRNRNHTDKYTRTQIHSEMHESKIWSGEREREKKVIAISRMKSHDPNYYDWLASKQCQSFFYSYKYTKSTVNVTPSSRLTWWKWVEERDRRSVAAKAGKKHCKIDNSNV